MLWGSDLQTGAAVLTRSERADEEHDRAEQERRQAEQDRRRAEKEHDRADEEHRRSEELTAEVARLKALLEEYKGAK
jgi:hypothetical protein